MTDPITDPQPHGEHTPAQHHAESAPAAQDAPAAQTETAHIADIPEPAAQATAETAEAASAQPRTPTPPVPQRGNTGTDDNISPRSNVPTSGSKRPGGKGRIRRLWQRIKRISTAIGAGILIAGTMLASVALVPRLRLFFSQEMAGNGIAVFMAYWIAAMAILVAAIYIQIILHEGGHLACGLAGGYRFVSFRVGSVILYRDGSRLRLGRYSLAGTGGQCLLEPPTDRMEDAAAMPYRAYCMGGAAANIAAAVIAATALAAGAESVVAAFAASMFIFTGIVMAAMNGIPMRIGGIPNDGENARIMARDPEMRRMLWVQLKVNALYSRGQRLCEMPDGWFSIPEDADLANHMYTSVAMFDVWRHIECRDFEAADTILGRIRAREGRMIELFRLETAADRAFVAILLRRPRSQIRRMRSDRVAQYISADARNNISHALELYAWERFVEGDAAKAAARAEAIRKALPRHHARGEAADCADLLAWMETLSDDYLCD